MAQNSREKKLNRINSENKEADWQTTDSIIDISTLYQEKEDSKKDSVIDISQLHQDMELQTSNSYIKNEKECSGCKTVAIVSANLLVATLGIGILSYAQLSVDNDH